LARTERRDSASVISRIAVSNRPRSTIRPGAGEGSGRALLRILEQRGFKPNKLEGSVWWETDDGHLRPFRRLMSPFKNESGKVIAFGRRALDPDDKAKYLKLIRNEDYRKSAFCTTEPAKRARCGSIASCCEGYMDAIGASQAGLQKWLLHVHRAHVEQIRAMNGILKPSSEFRSDTAARMPPSVHQIASG